MGMDWMDGSMHRKERIGLDETNIDGSGTTAQAGAGQMETDVVRIIETFLSAGVFFRE